jgi:TM2 domain-containing membrane protein YozV
MIRFACPACNCVLKTPPENARKNVNCPKCQTLLQVPNPEPLLGRLIPPTSAEQVYHREAAPPPIPKKTFDFTDEQAPRRTRRRRRRREDDDSDELSTAGQMMLYDANKKSAMVAYVLWFFLGIFGAHRFYLDYPGTGIMMLLMTVFGFALICVYVGFMLLLFVFGMVLVDAFLIPGMVSIHNHNLAVDLQ